MKPAPIETCPATVPARPVTQKELTLLVRHYQLPPPRDDDRRWRRPYVRACLRTIAEHYWSHGQYGPRDAEGLMVGWALDEWARSVAADGVLYCVGTGRDAYGVVEWLDSCDHRGVMQLVEEVARAIRQQPGRLAIGWVVDAINSHPRVVAHNLAAGGTYPIWYVTRQLEYWAGIRPLTQWTADHITWG